MRNKLTMKEFILSTIFTYVVGYFWYYGLLFMKYENKNVLQSNLILLSIHLGIYFVNFFITKKWDSNDRNIITTMLSGYTIYMYLTYAKYVKKIFSVSTGIALALVVAYGLFVYCRKVPSGKNPKKIFRLRSRRMYVGIRNIVALTGVALMVILFINRYVIGGLLVSSDYTQDVEVVEAEEYFLQYAEQFSKLTPEEWETFDEQEKLNILQYGANYEALSLGMLPNLTVYSSKLNEGNLGYFDGTRAMVQIDIEHLKNGDLESVYQVMAHELYHGAQYEYASTYESLDESQRKLSFFRDAAQYAKEWVQYKDSEKDGFEAYYTQQLESDARAYAIMAWHRMQGRIELYKLNIEEGKINKPIKETAKVHSLDDVTVLKGPLVKRETSYYDYGTVWVSDYSYDSKNRYDKVETYEIEAETDEKKLYCVDTYSYDDLFFYRDSEYFQEENLVTRNIFDVYGNTVQGQFVAGEVVRTNAFYYQYLCDTNKRKEVVLTSKYSGELEAMKSHIFCEYNDYGDMIYFIEQIGENVSETTWDYDYDKNDRITKMVEEKKYSYSLRCEITETSYQYDDSGKLVKTVESYMPNSVERPDEISYEIIKLYEYDSQDRLIQCRTERMSQHQDVSVTITVYEYQDEEDILQEV